MCKFLEYKSLHAFQSKSTIGLWLKVFFQSCFFLQKEAKKLFFETWFANLDGVWGWMHSSLYVKNWTCWYAAHTHTQYKQSARLLTPQHTIVIALQRVNGLFADDFRHFCKKYRAANLLSNYWKNECSFHQFFLPHHRQSLKNLQRMYLCVYVLWNITAGCLFSW